MKKIIYLFALLTLGLSIYSCSSDDDNNGGNYSYLKVGVDSIKCDSTVALGHTLNIKVYASFLSNCEDFYDFDFQSTGDFGRTITPIKVKNLDKTCGLTTFSRELPITFNAPSVGTYSLKFYNGVDAVTLLDKYITKNIKVTLQ